MSTIPLLIVGDSPDLHTGLGRIGHDVACLLATNPAFRLGYLGRGGFGRRRYPWATYNFHPAEQWGEGRIESAWEDLAGNDRGIIFTIWDASRLLWFAEPIGLPDRLAGFLTSGRFERWGYFMQDSTGVNALQLPGAAAHVMSRYNRVLLASQWAWGAAKNSIEHKDVDWLPHGINTTTFQPVDKLYGRSALRVPQEAILIGSVMANQARKHWPVVFEAVARTAGAWLWARCDDPIRYWDMQALAAEYGLMDRVVFEYQPLSDKELAMRYSACDLTLLISGGEGFGYPIAESMACGVPCITGEYGAGGELVQPEWRVKPAWTHIDTMHNVRRAMYGPEEVASVIANVLATPLTPAEVREAIVHLEWSKLKTCWNRWIARGLQS